MKTSKYLKAMISGNFDLVIVQSITITEMA